MQFGVDCSTSASLSSRGEGERTEKLSQCQYLTFSSSVFTPASFKITGFKWKSYSTPSIFFKTKPHTFYALRASINHTIRARQWNWFKNAISGHWRCLMRYFIIYLILNINLSYKQKIASEYTHTLLNKPQPVQAPLTGGKLQCLTDNKYIFESMCLFYKNH